MASVKHSFIWRRVCSALPAPAALVEIPAGTPVEKVHGEWFVKPSFFEEGSMMQHDAEYYGCRVAPDNVVDNKE